MGQQSLSHMVMAQSTTHSLGQGGSVRGHGASGAPCRRHQAAAVTAVRHTPPVSEPDHSYLRGTHRTLHWERRQGRVPQPQQPVTWRGPRLTGSRRPCQAMATQHLGEGHSLLGDTPHAVSRLGSMRRCCEMSKHSEWSLGHTHPEGSQRWHCCN